MTSLAHMTSHTIRPAYLTQIHRSATSIAFTHAPNHYLPCLPDGTPNSSLYITWPLDRITPTRHTCHNQHAPAPHDLRKSLYCPSRCASLVVPSVTRCIHVSPP